MTTESNIIITYGKAHHYSNVVLSIIEKMSRTIWLLDAGGGDRQISLPNYVNIDIQKTKGATNILCDLHRLPLKDNSFNLVINESVPEHVKKPWIVAKELQRVTKSGGITYVKAAFMQPGHTYPNHYFNMTKEGLLSLFDDTQNFTVLKSGVEEDQTPSYTLMLVLSNYLRLLSRGTSERMKDVEVFENRVFGGQGLFTRILVKLYLSVLDILKALDKRMDEERMERLAAGFFLLGKKN